MFNKRLLIEGCDFPTYMLYRITENPHLIIPRDLRVVHLNASPKQFNPDIDDSFDGWSDEQIRGQFMCLEYEFYQNMKLYPVDRQAIKDSDIGKQLPNLLEVNVDALARLKTHPERNSRWTLGVQSRHIHLKYMFAWVNLYGMRYSKPQVQIYEQIHGDEYGIFSLAEPTDIAQPSKEGVSKIITNRTTYTAETRPVLEGKVTRKMYLSAAYVSAGRHLTIGLIEKKRFKRSVIWLTPAEHSEVLQYINYKRLGVLQ